MSLLERAQKVAFWIAVICAALGFVTSAGCGPIPDLPGGLARWLHPILLALGVAAGLAASARNDEIDRTRWQVVEDPMLTSDERDYAHKYAERERRWASTAFLTAPLMLGYWMAYQLEGGGRRLEAQLLPLTAVIGAVLGYLVASLRARRRNPGS
jgi:hypothetical protein